MWNHFLERRYVPLDKWFPRLKSILNQITIPTCFYMKRCNEWIFIHPHVFSYCCKHSVGPLTRILYVNSWFQSNLRNLWIYCNEQIVTVLWGMLNALFLAFGLFFIQFSSKWDSYSGYAGKQNIQKREISWLLSHIVERAANAGRARWFLWWLCSLHFWRFSHLSC